MQSNDEDTDTKTEQHAERDWLPSNFHSLIYPQNLIHQQQDTTRQF
jgi:hypothetical protein